MKKRVINVSLPKSLLAKIENEVSGKNRSDKIVKCCELGYKILNGT